MATMTEKINGNFIYELNADEVQIIRRLFELADNVGLDIEDEETFNKLEELF